ncbi:hypothetical protein IAR55_006720 [Kwoniella newhampshirensis]|uniref:Fumarylacetoacetase-like C-terminal domain-containing protein n=1 Tax=Kwoniella newhampshirensis TaxID=1651941 RepID=A0AAW0YDU9_9TREE
MPVSTTTESTWLRLIRFIATEDGEEHLGEPVDVDIDIGLAYHDSVPILAYVLNALTPWDPLAHLTGTVLTVKTLLAPVTPQQAGTIRATGLSYKDHAAEMGLPFPSVPALFFKPSTCLANPGEEIPIPKWCQREEMDYEVELAIVIGKACKDVKEEDALNCVLGWTGANDLTARKHQTASTQWGYSKGFDKFCPLGPCLVSTRALPDPHVIDLQTTLNGQLMQNGSARKMIFPLAKVISYLSQGTTILPGSIIITGTPPGIGDGRTPRVWLKDGDQVHCWLSNGVGTLCNKIVYE